MALLEEYSLPAPPGLLDDGDEGLARQVAAQDEDLGLVIGRGRQEFSPADLRPMDVGGEE